MRALCFLLLATFVAHASTVNVYVFWGEGCPHCAKELEFLHKLSQKYPIKVKQYEIYRSPENRSLFEKFVKAYNVSPPYGVPTTFVGEDYLVGYGIDEMGGKAIEKMVLKCINYGCVDKGKDLVPEEETPGFCGVAAITSLLLLLLRRR